MKEGKHGNHVVISKSPEPKILEETVMFFQQKANKAEEILDYGRWAYKVGRSPAEVISVLSEQEFYLDFSGISTLGLAFRFAKAPDVVKLRAIVEDWDAARIARELN